MAKNEVNTVGLWRIDMPGPKSPDYVPLFAYGDTLEEVERNFKKWNDMSYQIVQVTLVGRVIVFGARP